MMNNSEILQKKVQPAQPEPGDSPSALRIISPKINLTNCQKNYHCVVFCPRNAISINQKGSPIINYDLCDGCLICLRECPATAILEGK